MYYISAELFELVSFFEVEPTFPFPDDPWPYTEALFESTQGDLSISFSIHPACKDVRIIVKSADNPIYELSAMGLDDVRYHREKFGERLECVISDAQSLSIWMRPTIRISEIVE